MIDERYIIMIHKHLRQELSEADQSTLQDWLEQAPEHRQAFHDLEKAWSLSNEYLASYTPNVEQGLNNLRKRIREDKAPALKLTHKRQSAFSFSAKIAAGLLFLIAAIVVWNIWFRPADMLVVATGPGEHKSIPLPDGSTVMLNENSQLTYPSFFRSDRQVVLSGEAFFDITRDEAHSFSIQTSNTKTEVLGTSFNLRAYENENFTEVEVVKGLVRLMDKLGTQPLELEEGARGTFRHDDRTILSDKPKTLNANFWQEGRLRFKDHQLTEAIDEINSRLNLHIELLDQQLSSCSFTIGLKLDHPDTIVAVIADIYGANWAKTPDGGYTIKGGNCNLE